jgi:SAM-dependent methyltransferase
MTESTGAFQRATGRDLEDDSGKPHYLRYQHDLMRPYLGRSTLEIGAGTGEFAAQLQDLDRLVVTDLDPGAVEMMGRRFAARPEVEAQVLDLDKPDIGSSVESVYAINVLEHIEHDVEALRSMAKMVVPGGAIVLWVPAYEGLYGDFDRKVGHLRRYTPTTVRRTAEWAGLSVEVARPINLIGALAWWAAVRKGGTGKPNPKMVGFYDKYLVPVTRALENKMPIPFGQSVLCVARTP